MSATAYAWPMSMAGWAVGVAYLVLCVTGCVSGTGTGGASGSPTMVEEGTAVEEDPESSPEPTVTPSGPFPTARVTLHPGADEAVTVAVHVAADPQTRARGLMHRDALPRGSGMLFVFPDDRAGPFWMQDTLVPLSIAFADSSGRILRILDMVPCRADPCELYDPDLSYRIALEVPRGDFERMGVTEGDTITVPQDLPTAR